jgi:hypothetical protein
MRLSDSVKLYGICEEMCPEYERVRRIVELDVKAPECVSIDWNVQNTVVNLRRPPRPNTYPAVVSEYQMSPAWSRHMHALQRAWTWNWSQRYALRPLAW